MALEERADALTAVDSDATTDVEPKRPHAPQVVSGNGYGQPGSNGHDADGAAPLDATSEGDRAQEAPLLDAPDDRPVRSPRKRTARQRNLLVASSVDAGALEDASPVDPLLAGLTAVEVEVEPDVDAEVLERAPETPADDRDTEAVPLLPPSTTAAAAAAAALYAPSPPRTEPVPLRPATEPVLVPPIPEPVPVVTALPVLAPVGAGQADTAAVPTPIVVPPPPQPRRRARPRVRKVTRIVRSVDAWSVFKIAVVFFLAMGVVLMTAAVLLWNLAQSTGTLDNVEGFFREAFQYDTFKLESEPLFRAALTLTALFVVVGTGLTVVVAVLFNLIADLTGGIRVTVLEREVVARDDTRGRRRRRKRTRPARTAPTTSVPPAPPLAGRDGAPEPAPPRG